MHFTFVHLIKGNLCSVLLFRQHHCRLESSPPSTPRLSDRIVCPGWMFPSRPFSSQPHFPPLTPKPLRYVYVKL